MKISLITPTYNSAKTLSRTIDSVISQTTKFPSEDLEYIILDGNSTDNTKEIVESYKEKYGGLLNIKFISEPDNGIYDAMNKGIKIATGEIIGILNSDDLFDNDNVLTDVIKAFYEQDVKIDQELSHDKYINTAQSVPDAVYGNISYFSDDVNKITRLWITGQYKESKLNNGWSIPHPALFVKKNIYEKYGYYNTNYRLAADYEFILRILKVQKIKTKYINKIFVRMYNGGSSAKNINNRKLGWQEIQQAWMDNSLKLPKFFVARRILSKIIQFIKVK